MSFRERGRLIFKHARRLMPTAYCRLPTAFWFCLLLTVLVCATARAQDTPGDNWSQFRGNHQLTGVSLSPVPNSLRQLWTYEAGDSIDTSVEISG